MNNIQDKVYDIFIIGGGINGIGIARDAAGRGYSVCLSEMNDFASGTSSVSSKLIHGGLRYLEQYKFWLVRESLKEREVLLKIAPHVIWPVRFVLPYVKSMRPIWILRFGLYIYDNIGTRKILPPTKKINLKFDISGEPLKPELKTGLEYSDCWVDDSRLVILNAIDASQKGANLYSYTKVVKATNHNGFWNISLKNKLTNEVSLVKARVLINASGPWVDQTLTNALGKNNAKNVRLVRGSHIVTKKLFNHQKSYIFQNKDGRIFFVMPYEDDFTLIGTTDKDHHSTIENVNISEDETTYLCDAVNKYFEKSISLEDVLWSYSGVRPLYNDGAIEAKEATRDYVISKTIHEKGLLLNIFGGKITTYRKLAEKILSMVESFLGKRKNSWTANNALPGGDMNIEDISTLTKTLSNKYPFIEKKIIDRLVRSYGTLSNKVLGNSKSKMDLGKHFGAGLYKVEVDYLVSQEWAISSEDILFRRTKLGLKFSKKEVDNLKKYLLT